MQIARLNDYRGRDKHTGVTEPTTFYKAIALIANKQNFYKTVL